MSGHNDVSPNELSGSDPDPLIASLTAAVDANPSDVTLRMHLAELLDHAGQRDAAVRHAGFVLAGDPTNSAALALIRAKSPPS